MRQLHSEECNNVCCSVTIVGTMKEETVKEKKRKEVKHAMINAYKIFAQ
jgi:hypothetical protein